MRRNLATLLPGLGLLALSACDSTPPEPTATPRWKAPREWAAAFGKETGAPSPTTPTQHAPNQGGAPRTLRSDRPAPPDPPTR